jgi:hypothetical protein
MLKASLSGQIRRTTLPKGRPLLPLCEVVINALQAVQDAAGRSHRVIIEIHRDEQLLPEKLGAVCGFTVSDTGVGFTDDNFNSFNTAFSEYKLHRGGKGLGRFIWLKAFDRVEIKSVFTDPRERRFQRSFVFDILYDPDNALSEEITSGPLGTTVRLVGFKEPYKSKCRRDPEQIALHIIQHFLLVFLHEKCPEFEIHDGGTRTNLNAIFASEFQAAATQSTFKIRDSEFCLHGFRLSTPDIPKHRLTYAANQRGVLSDDLGSHLPNLSNRLPIPSGGSFVYLAVVQGEYLNEHVNNIRTDFDLASSQHDETDQATLFDKQEILLSDIREECIKRISNDLSDVLDNINNVKHDRIISFTNNEAPQYKFLIKYISDFIDQIPPNASKDDLDRVLHRELYQREVRLKEEGSRIIKEADKIEDYEGYHKRLAEFMMKRNELGMSALALHVAHRRIVLDFLDRAISKSDGGKYPLVSVVRVFETASGLN